MGKMIDHDDPRIAEGHRRLDAYWQGVGRSDPDVISYLINPQFQGRPSWPNTRQAYRVVRTPGTLIIASDGLSDPFVDTNMDDANGFATEVFIETPDLVGANFSALRESWAFRLIENFAMNVADWGGIEPDLRQRGLLSTEFSAHDILPPDWLNEDGRAGFLVNTPVRGREMETRLPFGPVMIVPLTLLRPVEVRNIVDGGASARTDLAARLAATGNGHTSTLSRASVV